VNIFWFRRDLRLEDNAGLFHALSGDTEVLPIFIFDTNILGELPKDDPRVTFIHRLLEKINAGLKKQERSLAVFHGDPETVFKKLIETHAVSAVVANRDYEPYATKRDAELEKMLARYNVAFHSFKDQVIFETTEIAKDDGSPYVVFTPYSKKWKGKFAKTYLPHYASEDFLKNIVQHSYPFLSLDDIHFTKSEIVVCDFDGSDNFIARYEQTRNFPEKQTSRLGPHLRFGSVSIREIAAKATAAQNPTFLNELIWREFFMQGLWHFPQTVTKSFRPKYDNINWRNAEADFKKWCEGKTGYPIVDAGMRELNATGFMHNRVRMVTASFLCKHLLIDWRWGEALFAEKLLDYEQSSNIGNW
jgi:deoxyribodipyrimidine photo-lyase